MGIPSNDLNISQSGYVTFDGVATFAGRTFQAGSGISLTNANGVSGNTTIAVSGSAVGQTITGNDGNALSPSSGNWNIIGAPLANGTNASVTSGSGNTLTVTSINTAKWIVDPTANRGTHTTVQGAIDAASSGQTIFIRPGTYTENLTLKAGVNICAFISDGLTPNVTIVGKCTFTAAGTVSISGIRLQTNSDFFLAVTGSAASIVNLDYCYLNCSNNTGISFTSSSSSALIQISNCQANLGTTGIALFSHSSSGTLNLIQSNLSNTGGSTTASTCSAGGLNLQSFYTTSPITTSGTSGGTWEFSSFDTGTQNVACATFGGSGSQAARFCRFISGTASAISVSTTLSLQHCTANSSNANVITGAGSIFYSDIVFGGSSSTVNTTTKAGLQKDIGTFGTWTPSIKFGGASVGLTYAIQGATYQRIGKCVFFTFQINVSAKGSSTGNCTLEGFPFAPIVSTAAQYIPIPAFNAVTLSAGYPSIVFAFESSSTTANIYQYSNTGVGVAFVTDANFGSAFNLAGNGCYLLV